MDKNIISANPMAAICIPAIPLQISRSPVRIRIPAWSLLTITLGLAFSFTSTAFAQPAEDNPPNIILIFADDQGYQDLGVYGARGYETPNIDYMAANGIRFTSFYIPANVCTPSRAALMTGSYPIRAGIPTNISPKTTTGLNPGEITIAEVLKEKGYATMAIGKWHLGDHPEFLPTNQGFDHYYGLPYSNDMSPLPVHNPKWGPGRLARQYPPIPLLRDTTVLEREPDQNRITRCYTHEAIRFIENNQNNPFFLYLPHSFPHVPLHASEPFLGSTQQGFYGDVIREIDWSTGQIISTLEELGLSGQTLVIFTSDNGPALAYGLHAGKSGPFREGKGTTFEGGHRVPAIMYWPGQIPPGRVSDELVTSMDILPTVALLAGASLPDDRTIDGYDIWPILSGHPHAKSPYEKFYYYRHRELQAVRSGKWKLHVPHSYIHYILDQVGRNGHHGKIEMREIGWSLFNLEDDPGETHNLAGQYPAVVERLKKLITQGQQELGDDLSGTRGSDVREPGQVSEPWKTQLGPHKPLNEVESHWRKDQGLSEGCW